LLNFYERTLTDIDFSNNPDLAEEAEGIRKLSSSVGWIISYVTDYNQTREFLRSLGYTLPDISTLQDEDDDVMAYDPLEAFIISRYTYDQLVQN
jgi:hypothetical protein